ncbi:MAG: hypothetical protein RLP44_17345 [Aggregatilineales bacterium]
MTRLIFKPIVVILCVLIALCGVAPYFGEQMSVHLLAYNVTKPRERARSIYVLHVERRLSVNATPYSTGDYFIRVSPDGRWLIYRPELEPNDRFALVNLRTWQTRFLPALPPNSAFVSTQWEADSQQVWLNVYNRASTVVTSYIYDLPSAELIETDDAPPIYPPIMRDQITIGLPISMNATGDPQLGVTLDDAYIPRLYDYASDDAIISFEIGRDLQPVSISPNNEFLVAVLNRNRQIDLYLVPAWAGEPTNLTHNSDNEGLPVWSSDGNYIAYTSQSDPRRTATNELRVYDVTSGSVAYVVYYGATTMIDNTPPTWIP